MIWRSSGVDDGGGDLESQQAVRCALQQLTDDLEQTPWGMEDLF